MPPGHTEGQQAEQLGFFEVKPEDVLKSERFNCFLKG